MPTIQDQLREEARDYQELAAMSYKVYWRERLNYQASEDWSKRAQEHLFDMAYNARSALLALIGAEPE